MLSHRLYLTLLHMRHMIYFACAVMFTVAATTVGYQPYFEQAISKSACFGLMLASVVIGLSYTAFIKHFPHK